MEGYHIGIMLSLQSDELARGLLSQMAKCVRSVLHMNLSAMLIQLQPDVVRLLGLH